MWPTMGTSPKARAAVREPAEASSDHLEARREMLSRKLAVLRAVFLPVALAGLMVGALAAAQPVGAQPSVRVDSLPWINQASGKCLDVPNGSKKNNIQPQIYTCNSNKWQKWDDRKSGPTGYFIIFNTYTKKCLDIRKDDPHPGAAVIQYTCNASNYENWHLVDCEAKKCHIQNEGNDNYMIPSGCGTSNGDLIYMNVCRNQADVWS
jgi:hypothetical protein